jgi:hypothetical protein
MANNIKKAIRTMPRRRHIDRINNNKPADDRIGTYQAAPRCFMRNWATNQTGPATKRAMPAKNSSQWWDREMTAGGRNSVLSTATSKTRFFYDQGISDHSRTGNVAALGKTTRISPAQELRKRLEAAFERLHVVATKVSRWLAGKTETCSL